MSVPVLQFPREPNYGVVQPFMETSLWSRFQGNREFVYGIDPVQVSLFPFPVNWPCVLFF